MGLLPKQSRDSATWTLAFALACGVPFAAYVATASPHSYWLDAGELVESGVMLDIAHPPGHPVAALVGHLFTYLPFGPLALRIALGQAICASIAAGFIFRAIEITIIALDVRQERVSIPLALAATWIVCCSYPFWFQAIRPEVYALQTMLIMVAVERLVRLEASWPTHDIKPLYVAALALGLGLANHHFMAVMAFPAFAPTLARVYRARGHRPLLISMAAMGAGLTAYIYLPVRADTDPPVALGDPNTFERFFWVVSARAYQHTNQLTEASGFDRTLEVIQAVVDGFPLLALLLAIAGMWALARAPGARRIGWIWGALTFFALAGRAWLGHTADNPDALGYLGPAFVGFSAMAAAFVAAALATLGASSTHRPQLLPTIAAITIAALALWPIERTRERTALANFDATDVFDEWRIRSLPPRAVVIAHMPQTVFRYWELMATEQVRPDITLVPIPFLGYPGMLDRVLHREPELQALLRGYLLEGELRQPDLQTIAARRPVLVEMDARVPLELDDTLMPSGLFYQVVDGGVTSTDVRDAGRRRAELLGEIRATLEAGVLDSETRAQLLWVHYLDAIYYARAGAIERARESTMAGLELREEEPLLNALAERLADPSLDGPIDVRPFLVAP